MCWLMKVFCTPCQKWVPNYVDYCPRVDKSWIPWMPCYGPNVVFFFQTDHIKTVYNGLCDEHRKMKEKMEEEMEILAAVLGGSDMLGVREEARSRMNELAALLGGVKMDGGAEAGSGGAVSKGM